MYLQEEYGDHRLVDESLVTLAISHLDKQSSCQRWGNLECIVKEGDDKYQGQLWDQLSWLGLSSSWLSHKSYHRKNQSEWSSSSQMGWLIIWSKLILVAEGLGYIGSVVCPPYFAEDQAINFLNCNPLQNCPWPKRCMTHREGPHTMADHCKGAKVQSPYSLETSFKEYSSFRAPFELAEAITAQLYHNLIHLLSSPTFLCYSVNCLQPNSQISLFPDWLICLWQSKIQLDIISSFLHHS